MRFLATNLCSEDATVITASSSDVNFPVRNLKNPLRSKRWRSSGTFVVDSTNNKINFKEASLGSELTATITSGSYSPTALQAEIKAKLEAVGADTFTVVFSQTTGLWTVSSDGTYLSLLNSTGTNAANSLLVQSLGFPASNKTGSLTYTGSQIAIHTKETIVFDLLTTQDISSVVILWPKEDGIKLSPNAILKIEGNATNVWTSPAVSQTLTVDNNYLVASHFFATPQSLRYWRVSIQDQSNPDFYVELGMVWIGENVDFNEPENGFKFKLEDNSRVSTTDFGHRYFDEYPQTTVLDFDYKFIEYATAQNLENVYRENGTRKPVLVVFDETELVFSKNHFLIYGTMGKSFDLSHVSYDLFSGGLKITELG